MIKLNDHYFISWLYVVKRKTYYIEDGKIRVNITPEEYSEFLIEYKKTYKPVLVQIRKVVKELNIITSKK